MKRPFLKFLLLASVLPLARLNAAPTHPVLQSLMTEKDSYPAPLLESALFLKQMCQCSDLATYLSLNPFQTKAPLSEAAFLKKALPAHASKGFTDDLKLYYQRVMRLGQYLEGCLQSGAYKLSDADKDQLRLYRAQVKESSDKVRAAGDFKRGWMKLDDGMGTNARALIAIVLERQQQKAPDLFKTTEDAKIALEVADKASSLDLPTEENNATYLDINIGRLSSPVHESLFAETATLYMRLNRCIGTELERALLAGTGFYGDVFLAQTTHLLERENSLHASLQTLLELSRKPQANNARHVK